MKTLRCILLITGMISMLINPVRSQDKPLSNVLVYFEFLDATFTPKAERNNSLHYLVFNKLGDRSMKRYDLSINGIAEMGNLVRNSKTDTVEFCTGDLLVPVIKEDTIFRSKKKYSLKNEYFVPLKISYFHTSIEENIKVEKIPYGNGIIFIISDCPDGNLKLTNIELTKTLSIDLPESDFSRIFSEGQYIYFGSFRILNPSVQVTNDVYYMWQKEPIRVEKCNTPNEKDLLLFLKEKKKMGSWTNQGLKRLSELE
jgi:hypothetical protein